MKTTLHNDITELQWKRAHIDAQIDESLSRLKRYGLECVCGKGRKYCDGSVITARCVHDTLIPVLVRYCVFCGGYIC